MKYLPNIAGALLGLAFIAFSMMFFFPPGPMPEPVGPAEIGFAAAFGTTGWMTLVKVCELIGGILTAIPKTRNIGLLFLGPVIINIAAFHQFAHHEKSLNTVIIVISALALYLLWSARKKFAGLLN